MVAGSIYELARLHRFRKSSGQHGDPAHNASSDAIVSRIERQERRVTLAIAFACQLTFGAEPGDIYPALLEQVEDGVVRRMYELYSQLKTRKPTQRQLLGRESL